jgi:hypothetical protein
LAFSGAAMLREWKWSNRRGTLVLSAFAVVSAILATFSSDVRWLIGGTIILARWPYAYFVMMPVNTWLFVIPPGTAVSPLHKLTRGWGCWNGVMMSKSDLPSLASLLGRWNYCSD